MVETKCLPGAVYFIHSVHVWKEDFHSCQGQQVSVLVRCQLCRLAFPECSFSSCPHTGDLSSVHIGEVPDLG